MNTPMAARRGAGMPFALKAAVALAAAAACGYVVVAGAQTHQRDTAAAAAVHTDGREPVKFPAPMRLHIITSMRDHLLALQEIDVALSKSDFDNAARIAEQRLGMSSLGLHGAHDIAPYMPQGMQDIGTQMHRSASRFAVEAQNASVDNDVRPALAALGMVMQQCVACHATYRLH